MARNFPASTASYINLGDLAGVDFAVGASWSWFAFFRVEETATDDRCIFSKFGSSTDRVMKVQTDVETAPASLEFFFNASTESRTGNIIELDTWYVVAIVNISGGGTDDLRYYVYELDLTEILNDPRTHPGDPGGTATPITIGVDNGEGSASDPFDGDIAHVAYVRAALSEQDVKSFVGNPHRSVLDWRRRGLSVDFYHPLGLGSPEPDLSGSGNNGTLNGSTTIGENPPVGRLHPVGGQGGSNIAAAGGGVDTEQKRRSVPATGRRWRAPSLLPDGTMTEGDRRAAARNYWREAAGVVTATNLLRYDQLGDVEVIRILHFDRLVSAEATLAILFDVLGAATKTELLRIDFLGGPIATRLLRWDQRGAVEVTNPLLYDQEEDVEATRLLRLDQLRAAEATDALRFDQLALAEAIRLLRWDQRGAVSKTSPIRYDHVVSVSVDRDLFFDLLLRAQGTALLRFDQLEGPIATLLLRWDQRGAVEAARALRFDRLDLAVGTSLVRYDMVTSLQVDGVLRIDVLGQVGPDGRLRFDFVGSVSATGQVRYDQRGSIVQTLLLRFDVSALALIVGNQTLRFDLVRAVLKESALRYDQSGGVAIAREFTVNVHGLTFLVTPTGKTFVVTPIDRTFGAT